MYEIQPARLQTQELLTITNPRLVSIFKKSIKNHL